MGAATGDRVRRTPRQALLILDVPWTGASDRPERQSERRALATTVLSDLIGSMTALNGVTMAVACADAKRAFRLASFLPPGVDVLAPPDGLDDPATLAWAMEDRFERSFERVVAVVGDAIGLPARVTATAFGGLASADLVVGAARAAGGVYLVGARSEAGLAMLSEVGGGAITAIAVERLRTSARAAGSTLRSVEPMARLADLPELGALRAALEAAPTLTARTTELVERTHLLASLAAESAK